MNLISLFLFLFSIIAFLLIAYVAIRVFKERRLGIKESLTSLGIVISIILTYAKSPSVTAQSAPTQILTPALTSITSVVAAPSPKFAAPPTLIPHIDFTSTPSPQPPSQLLPTNTPTAQSLAHSCIKSEYSSLGNGWTSPELFSRYTVKGETRIYSHCPPSSSIQYTSIVADDLIVDVIRVCSQSSNSVHSLFKPFTVEGELLQYYRSSQIDLKPDCRIDFVVQDDNGQAITRASGEDRSILSR